MKLLDFLGQHFFLKFLIRKISNVHKSRGNSLTSLRVPTAKLQPFSAHSRSCFMLLPRYQGTSCTQFTSGHGTCTHDSTEQADTPVPCNHYLVLATIHPALYVKPFNLPTILGGRYSHLFAVEGTWSTEIKYWSDITQENETPELGFKPRHSRCRGYAFSPHTTMSLPRSSRCSAEHRAALESLRTCSSQDQRRDTFLKYDSGGSPSPRQK